MSNIPNEASGPVSGIKTSQIDHEALGHIFKNEHGNGQVSSVLDVIVGPSVG